MKLATARPHGLVLPLLLVSLNAALGQPDSLRGTITAVGRRSRDLCEIDLGKRDGIRVGDRLSVYSPRDRRRATASITIVAVQDDVAVGRGKGLEVGFIVGRRRQVAEQDNKIVQIQFSRPIGMQVSWRSDRNANAGVVPVTYDVPTGEHQLTLSNVPGRPRVTYYPTLIMPSKTPRSRVFLDEMRIQLTFTEEDFDQALTGNLVTKVIYLPDPEFQRFALAGVEPATVRLDPGIDPIVEADRRGTILAIVHLGNRDKRNARPSKRSQSVRQSRTSKKLAKATEATNVDSVSAFSHTSR